ncbi:probable cytochrome P450 6a20 [Culex pipiens pallens]|uniref:probable cytochrome P450 6a20 n=1 Tax=Culex pipiens pallens TaxID=42434 RepID=UPI001954C870|nr:probable cytochrome P450 6a20 [Culex pipiens pallens]
MFQYWDIVGTLAFLALNLYLFRKHAYWTSRNVPFRQPGFLYGNTKAMGRTEQVGKFFQSFYTDLKGLNPLVGMYHYLRPIALMTDLGLVRRVLEEDFQCFQGRGSYCDEKVDPLSGRLFNLSGDRWNKIHNIIAPLFGENNLKTMFSMLLTSGNHLSDQLGDKVEVGKEIEIKNWLKQYIPDLMAKSYLGVDIQLKTISRQEKFKGFLMNYMSKLARILRISEFKPEVSKHFLKLISAETESRSKNNIRKDDLLDMLIQQWDPNESKEGQLAFNELAAQAFGSYYAGLETYPALLTWTLFELSNAQVMQKKARQHVKTALAKFNGEICFDSISAMTYLDQIVKESLRKYPPIPVLIRETT